MCCGRSGLEQRGCEAILHVKESNQMVEKALLEKEEVGGWGGVWLGVVVVVMVTLTGSDP